jgi:hypothetical protein
MGRACYTKSNRKDYIFLSMLQFNIIRASRSQEGDDRG